MEKTMLRVMKQGTLQTFQSSKTGEVISKIAIQFTDGLDTFEAEAFDKFFFIAMKTGAALLGNSAAFGF